MSSSYLIFKLKPVRQDGILEIMLQGMVPAPVVKNVQMRLMRFKSRTPQVAHMIPMLRIETGYWVFKSHCPSVHHGTIIMECFIEVFELCGFKTMDVRNKINGFAPPNCTLFKSEEKGLAHCIPPGVGEAVGGDIKADVKLNPITSVELKSNSSVPLAEIIELSDGRLVFGVGWGSSKSTTDAMLGLPNAIDIDLNVYVCNKYGEVIQLLSPKGNRQLRKLHKDGIHVKGGLQVSIDNRGGTSVGDDERFVFEPRFLPPYVDSIVVCLQIQSGARSFREVFDVHLRLLDTHEPGIENEHVIFHLDQSQRDLGKKGTCCLMGQIVRKDQGFAFRTMGQVCKVAEQGLLQAGLRRQLPSEVILRNFKVRVPATDMRGVLKAAKQGTVDPYIKIFIEYWVKAGKVSMSKAAMLGHRKESHHGLILKQGGRSGQVIVRYIIDGTPAQAAGFAVGDVIVEVNGKKQSNFQQVKSFLDRQTHKTSVRFLVFRDQMYRHVNLRMGGPIERKRNMLYTSEVKSKLPGPCTVEYKDVPDIKIVPASMTGYLKDKRSLCYLNRYGLVVIECFDKDRMSRDDKIFRHEINMDQLFDEGLDTDSDWFKTKEQKPVDYAIHSNGPFTHCQVYFHATRRQ